LSGDKLAAWVANLPPCAIVMESCGGANYWARVFQRAGQWYWPNKDPQGPFYSISGIDRLGSEEKDIILELALTAHPTSMKHTASKLGFPAVRIHALEYCQGNGALSHTLDGNRFRQRMHELMHQLRNQNGVERIHLLPCA